MSGKASLRSFASMRVVGESLISSTSKYAVSFGTDCKRLRHKHPSKKRPYRARSFLHLLIFLLAHTRIHYRISDTFAHTLVIVPLSISSRENTSGPHRLFSCKYPVVGRPFCVVYDANRNFCCKYHLENRPILKFANHLLADRASLRARSAHSLRRRKTM